MYSPTLKDFKKLAKEHNLIPVYREIVADLETPVSAFLKLGESDYSFLLESVEGAQRYARYSFLGNNPYLVVTIGNRKAKVKGQVNKVIDNVVDPLVTIKELLSPYKPAHIEGLPPFQGGAVGYLGYDNIRYFEDIPKSGKSDLDVPETIFVFTDNLLVFDHLKHKIKVVVNAHIKGDVEEVYNQTLKKIDKIIGELSRSIPSVQIKDFSNKKEVNISSNLSEQQFIDMVEKAKDYIVAGDIIQVVLSQRFEAKIEVPSFDVYRVLRTLNPSPYMYYLKFDGFKLVGSSPEPLVKVEGYDVVTRPIAGTRRRGIDAAEDAKFEIELLNDEKEKAEHLMLVDLGRNDLGRVSEPGTVEVTDFMFVEKYSHVMHMVSNVVGKLEKDKNAFDALRSVFPAGTVSGAPKIRAMEIIDELEPTLRGPYAGAIGYFSYSGDLDTCIAIRTILIKDSTAYIQAGAGIVYDSDPKAEYKESINKAKALLKAIELA
ncbi:MAG: anthranilate synthase component I [Actinobacteria bacterium]|nr:MAG: anthranilate synthase component I [Actinomycetota bacterium]